jgi:hypothetical protein
MATAKRNQKQDLTIVLKQQYINASDVNIPNAFGVKQEVFHKPILLNDCSLSKKSSNKEERTLDGFTLLEVEFEYLFIYLAFYIGHVFLETFRLQEWVSLITQSAPA